MGYAARSSCTFESFARRQNGVPYGGAGGQPDGSNGGAVPDQPHAGARLSHGAAQQSCIVLSKLRHGDVVPAGTLMCIAFWQTNLPADFLTLEGNAEVDESSLTGESEPVRKNDNSDVYAGTIVTDGEISAKCAQ